MDKCREEFEAYMLKSGYGQHVLSKSSYYDCYNYAMIDEMYSAWKASRESMKAIKLPEVVGADMDGNNQVMLASEVIRAITSAGYKVEE